MHTQSILNESGRWFSNFLQFIYQQNISKSSTRDRLKSNLTSCDLTFQQTPSKKTQLSCNVTAEHQLNLLHVAIKLCVTV